MSIFSAVQSQHAKNNRRPELVSKEEIPGKPCDPRVEVMGNVKGKFEQVKLLDLNLMDKVLFLQMNISVFWDLAPYAIGGMQLFQSKR
jgi:hypothetical protein